MIIDESTVRSLLVPMDDGFLLLPSSVVAEVVSYERPVPMSGDYPSWLLGRFNWRGLRVPCLSFEGLNGGAGMTPASRGRVLILKALTDRPDLPYFAIVAQGIPRLISVDAESLETMGDGSEHALDSSPAVISAVLAMGEPAFIPDMRFIEDRVYSALYG